MKFKSYIVVVYLVLIPLSIIIADIFICYFDRRKIISLFFLDTKKNKKDLCQKLYYYQMIKNI